MPECSKKWVQKASQRFAGREEAQNQRPQTGGPQVPAAQGEGQQHQAPAQTGQKRQVCRSGAFPPGSAQKAVIDPQTHTGQKNRPEDPQHPAGRDHPKSLWSQLPDCCLP